MATVAAAVAAVAAAIVLAAAAVVKRLKGYLILLHLARPSSTWHRHALNLNGSANDGERRWWRCHRWWHRWQRRWQRWQRRLSRAPRKQKHASAGCSHVDVRMRDARSRICKSACSATREASGARATSKREDLRERLDHPVRPREPSTRAAAPPLMPDICNRGVWKKFIVITFN